MDQPTTPASGLPKSLRKTSRCCATCRKCQIEPDYEDTTYYCLRDEGDKEFFANDPIYTEEIDDEDTAEEERAKIDRNNAAHGRWERWRVSRVTEPYWDCDEYVERVKAEEG